MKKINNFRADLIFNQYKCGSCSPIMSDVLKTFLQKCPSITEEGQCDRKGCQSREHVMEHPVVSISADVFNNNMANLKSAILDNFPNENLCQKCRNPLTTFQRAYGQHIFIEVSATKSTSNIHTIYEIHMSFQRFNFTQQIPGASSFDNIQDSIAENTTKYKLADIPDLIELSNVFFVLVGAIVFLDPLTEDDIGHYVCASKVHSTWEFFDDMNESSYKKSSKQNVSIHTLMYAFTK